MVRKRTLKCARSNLDFRSSSRPAIRRKRACSPFERVKRLSFCKSRTDLTTLLRSCGSVWREQPVNRFRETLAPRRCKTDSSRANRKYKESGDRIRSGAGRVCLHLCEATVNEQLGSGDKAAVVGCEKDDGFGDFIGSPKSAKWNGAGKSLQALLARLYTLPQLDEQRRLHRDCAE